MIFKPVLIEKILTGQKHVTRRNVADDGNGGPAPCRYEVGKVYGIQPGMARPSVGKIRVLDVRREPLGNVDDAEAKLEGFASASDFRTYWLALHDHYGQHWPVYRIEFEVVAVLAFPCGSCDGHGYEPIGADDRAEFVEGCRR